MKKFNVKKVGLFAIPLLLLIAGVMMFQYFSYSSSRIVLKDQAKMERILLHNAKEDHACHCFPPMISTNPGFKITVISATSASFRWVCDVAATYQVNYGLTSNHGTKFPEKAGATYKDQTITVTGLKPATIYHAQPYSQVSGHAVKTWLMQNTSQQDWTFKTLEDIPVVTYSIKGSILDDKGVGISGVTVKLTGDTTITVTTTSSGVYEFTKLKDGKTYTITPTKTDYTFVPPSQAYSSLKTDYTQNYAGDHEVSVKRDNNGQPCIFSKVIADKITTTDANITWNTNLLSTSQVEYGTTKNYGLKSGENTQLVTDHYIQLFDLKPGVTYYFKVISKTSTGEAFSSPSDFKLTTQAFEKRIVDKNDVFTEPNPCINDVVFNYRLFQQVNNVSIDILTLSGRQLAVLEAPSTACNPGWNRISWDVKDHSGKKLINGLYIYVMRFTKNGVEHVSERSQFMVRR